eukprot:m.63976 g.63976  ORF g.63976 m.63976 type:complete len:81 (-) comp9691_c0_seq3:1775-2017(-)
MNVSCQVSGVVVILSRWSRVGETRTTVVPPYFPLTLSWFYGAVDDSDTGKNLNATTLDVNFHLFHSWDNPAFLGHASDRD